MKNILIVLASACGSLFINPAAAQTAAADNKLSETITFHPIPGGPSVLGVFEGRPPCAGLVRQLDLPATEDCSKLKCDLTLYRDPATSQPTTYTLSVVGAGDLVKTEGNAYRQKTLSGNWTIIKGSRSNPRAKVFRLSLGKPGACLYLLKGDENILFILDENREFRTGNEDFSFTLNRVKLVPAK
jgi:hypothetical protein